jgi:hypothetical protein
LAEEWGPPQIKEAFQTAKRYQERYAPIDLVNFDKTLDGHSWFVFAKKVAGELDGNDEALFEWLHKMSKYAMGLAKLAKAKKAP